MRGAAQLISVSALQCSSAGMGRHRDAGDDLGGSTNGWLPPLSGAVYKHVCVAANAQGSAWPTCQDRWSCFEIKGFKVGSRKAATLLSMILAVPSAELHLCWRILVERPSPGFAVLEKHPIACGPQHQHSRKLVNRFMSPVPLVIRPI